MSLIGDRARINVIGPHCGEEPCSSSASASCNLRCVLPERRCCPSAEWGTRRLVRALCPGAEIKVTDMARHLKSPEVGNVHSINSTSPPLNSEQWVAALAIGQRPAFVWRRWRRRGGRALERMRAPHARWLQSSEPWRCVLERPSHTGIASFVALGVFQCPNSECQCHSHEALGFGSARDIRRGGQTSRHMPVA